RAISEYLATKYRDDGPQLLPPMKDMEKCALSRQWASVEYSQFSPFAVQLLMRNIMRGIPCDELLALQIIKRLEDKLDVLNTILGQQPFIVGATFSLIDIFYMPMVDMLYQAG
ncbi:glutathione S-transferase, partial [Aspergillus saccharolyticus JOP 1030-1]